MNGLSLADVSLRCLELDYDAEKVEIHMLNERDLEKSALTEANAKIDKYIPMIKACRKHYGVVSEKIQALLRLRNRSDITKVEKNSINNQLMTMYNTVINECENDF